MASRRDQYQGYRFVTRRQTGALLREDSDVADAPLRRLSNGMVGGIVVAVLAMAVAGLWGLLSPSNAPGWQNGKSLIVARDNGTRYVYLNGTLHPVLNYASALLILKAGAVTPVDVTRGALNTVPQGRPVGISGAPDAVPGSGSIVSGAWTVCDDQAADSLGAQAPQVTLYAGASAGALTPLPSTDAVLVQDQTDEAEYLIWNGERLRLNTDATALGYTGTPLPVSAAWINAVPPGPQLTAPEPNGLGESGRPVSGAPSKVGALYSVGTSDYVMETDGLAPITPIETRLLEADPRVKTEAYDGGPVTPRPASVSDLDNLSAVNPSLIKGLPQSPPNVISTSTGSVSVCATLASASQDTVTIATRTVAAATVSSTAEPTDNGTPVANTVRVPAGRGALVKLVPTAGDTLGTEYLVTDVGVKYPIAGSSVLTDLGLAGVATVQLPPGFVDLMTTGPALDESAASNVQADDPKTG